jgi:hypothetical protein
MSTTPPDLTLTLSYPSPQATPYGPVPGVGAETQIVGWTGNPFLPRNPSQPDFVRTPR